MDKILNALANGSGFSTMTPFNAILSCFKIGFNFHFYTNFVDFN